MNKTTTETKKLARTIDAIWAEYDRAMALANRHRDAGRLEEWSLIATEAKAEREFSLAALIMPAASA